MMSKNRLFPPVAPLDNPHSLMPPKKTCALYYQEGIWRHSLPFRSFTCSVFDVWQDIPADIFDDRCICLFLNIFLGYFPQMDIFRREFVSLDGMTFYIHPPRGFSGLKELLPGKVHSANAGDISKKELLSVFFERRHKPIRPGNFFKKRLPA